MCRWMAWLGQPVLIEELLFKTQHGIVDQSLHSRMGAEPTNGDGFGLGWYGAGEGPGALPQRRAGVGGRQPARARGARRVAAVPRPRARGDRLARAADELPPVPPRQLAVRPQRLHRRPRTCSGASSCWRSTRSCSRTSRGSTDTEVVFQLALTLGLEETRSARWSGPSA